MLAASILGATAADQIPASARGVAVFLSSRYRQIPDAHIVVSVRDIAPRECQAQVIAYRAWHPGPHGASCPCCDPPQSTDDWYLWGEVKTVRLPIRHGKDDERIDTAKLLEAIHTRADALRALAPSPLRWCASGPTYLYGRWETEQDAAGWLASHMERLSMSPHLCEEYRQVARINARALRRGARMVRLAGETYGVGRS